MTQRTKINSVKDPASTLNQRAKDGSEPLDDDLIRALGFSPDDLMALTTWTMPFGKYAGRTLLTLPEEYLFWFRAQGFPDNRLGKLLALCLELKIEGLDDLLKPLLKAPGER